MSAIGTPDAAAYLAALEHELSDLASDEREDLLEEVEASLLEIDEDPVARLGSPARFAAELRESAGLPPAPAPAPPAPPRLPLRERLAASPTLRSARAFGRELAPIWWAARAYVVVLVLAAAFAAPVLKVGGIPRIGSAEGGAALLGAALLVSVALGLAGRRRRLPARSLGITVNVALMGCALFLLFYEFDRRVLTGYSYDPAPIEAAQPLTLSYDGAALNNVYVYDADGELLQDVRLYDDYGRPLDVRYGDPDPTRRVLTDASGATAFNTFPIRFYEPGTRRVSNPDAAPSSLRPPKLSSRTPSSP